MEQVRHVDGGDVGDGWGWVVVYSSFLIHVIVGSVNYFFHTFLVFFLKDFHDGPSETEFIWELQPNFVYIIGPVAAALTNKYGCQVVTTAGAIISCFSFIFSFLYAHSLYFMYFALCVMAGIGFGLIYLPSIVIVAQYFEKRRAFTTGLAVCGSGVGPFVQALLTEHLLEVSARRGAILVMGGIFLVVIVCGVLFSPPEVPRRPVVAVTGQNIESGSHRVLFALLKNPVFLVFAISNFLIFIDLTMLFTLPWNTAMQTDSGVWTTPLVYVISCVVFGYVSDKQWVDRLMLYNTVLIICGGATALIPFFDSKPLETFPITCGICIGVYETLTSVLLVDLLGIELLPSSLGFLMLFQGAAHVIGQRVSDWLPVLKDGYEIYLVIKCAVIAISGAMLFVLSCERNKPPEEKVHQIEMGKLQTTISTSAAETYTIPIEEGMLASDPAHQKAI